MKILGRTSSINVRKVLWTAAEIGLRFEHEESWAASRSTSEPEFAALNPHRLVPVLIDDSGALWESNTICRYLAGIHGRHDLLPAEPYSKALVERWMDWCAGDLNAAWRYAFMALVRRDPAYADERLIAESTSSWNDMMIVLNDQLAKAGPFICGDNFTLADIALGLAAHRWYRTPLSAKPDLLHIERYLAELRRRPGFGALANEDLP